MTKKKTKIKDIEDFQNPNDFYFQKNFNSMNEIIMTEDDQFFRSFPGQVLFDPDRVATTRVFAFAQCVRQGGDILCPFFNVEADVYLRMDFFDRAKLLYEISLAGVFRQTLGYNNTIWTNDLLGRTRPYLNETTFKNQGSDVWKQAMERGRDVLPEGVHFPRKRRQGADDAAAAYGARLLLRTPARAPPHRPESIPPDADPYQRPWRQHAPRTQ